ncbi:MAG: hypothetical protein IT480_03865, partial [Gammaproteobacteria bacterium]|nr:hypothetical protein [Gammaproteobacteria bacterium]
MPQQKGESNASADDQDFGTPATAGNRQSRTRLNALELLVVSEACAFAFAIVYTVVFTLALPPTDGAYGQAPFADPLVITIMSMVAGVAGLAAWPFVYFTLRRRNLVQGLLRAGGLTLAWIILVTPQSGLAGMFGSFPVFVVGLLWCAATLRPLVAPGECERCGYNLTGNSSGKCPECGTATPHRRAQGDEGELFCMGCAYDLAGLESSRCPECGRAFDRDDPNSVSRSANCVRWRRLQNRMGWLYFASLLTGSAIGISASMTGAPSEIVRFVCIAGGAWGLVFLSARLLTRRVERKA